MKDVIASIVRGYEPVTVPLGAMIESAVLVPLVVRDDGGLSLLLTARSLDVTHHKGQVSFPGGVREPEDADLVETALRETEEEVGLSRDLVEVVGPLDDFVTISNYRVTPYVGLVHGLDGLDDRSDEIDEVFLVDFADLLDRAVPTSSVTYEIGDVTRTMPLYVAGGRTIWGATAMMLHSFMAMLEERAEEPFFLRARAMRFLERAEALGDTIALTTHVNPDADGIGAMLALAGLLERRGKRCIPVISDALPRSCRFLPRSDTIVGWSKAAHERIRKADGLILVDTAEPHRAGAWVPGLVDKGMPTITVDHHRGDFGIEGLTVPTSSSTGEIMAELFEAVGEPLDEATATQLYAAILFDTGGFRFIRQRARTLQVAAKLVAAGAPTGLVQEQIFSSHSPGYLRLLTLVLERARFFAHHRIVWATVLPEDLSEAQVARDEVKDVIQELMKVDTVDVAVVAKAGKDGKVKLSMRSKSGYAIYPLCKRLGGGGHANAAGATVEGTVDDILEQILPDLHAVLDDPTGTQA